MYLPNNFSTIPYEFQHAFISKSSLWPPKNFGYQIPSTDNLIQQTTRILKIIWTNFLWFLSYSADRICFYYKNTPTTTKMAVLIIFMLLLLSLILCFVIKPIVLFILYIFGFVGTGIVKGSIAATYQATQGGVIVAKSIFSILQSIAALSTVTMTHLLGLLAQLPLRACI